MLSDVHQKHQICFALHQICFEFGIKSDNTEKKFKMITKEFFKEFKRVSIISILLHRIKKDICLGVEKKPRFEMHKNNKQRQKL